jgi:hypothetical protein
MHGGMNATGPEFVASTIDEIICAEIPGVNVDPFGYSLVDELMMHAPCDAYNRKCLCLKNNEWSKNFPKAFQDETMLDEFEFYNLKKT